MMRLRLCRQVNRHDKVFATAKNLSVTHSRLSDMTITLDGVDVAQVLQDAMRRGTDALGAGDTALVVTRSFVATVRRITGEKQYQAERGSGVVAARTCVAADGTITIVVNWNAVGDRQAAELERLAAHEAAHVRIRQRGEDASAALDAAFDDVWNFNLAGYADIAIEEYRCEAAVFAAGYQVEESRSDLEIEAHLRDLNVETIKAKFEYDTVHQDPATARFDVLRCLAYTSRTLGCLAARHLHCEQFLPKNLSTHARANWVELVAPPWIQLLALVRNVPDATKPWPNPEPAKAATAALPIMNLLSDSLGFKGEPEAFWLLMDQATYDKRLARANAEAGYESDST